MSGSLQRRAKATALALFSVHTLDIVRCSVAERPPELSVDQGLVLHRVDGGDLLIDAAQMGTSPIILSLSRVELIDRLAAARRRRRFYRRTASGQVAYIATKDGDVAGWLWLSTAQVFRDRWIGLRMQFAPDERYIYDLWVYPNHRSSGVGAFLVAGMLRDLQREGLARWVYGYVDRANRPNQVLLRLIFGFRSVQSVKLVRMLVVFGRVLLPTAKPPTGPCARQGLASV
jgi:ribosomal protein S18 acetylase RimI-like enzyme